MNEICKPYDEKMKKTIEVARDALKILIKQDAAK